MSGTRLLRWRAWTDGEQVKRWWGPRGFTAPVARMDVRGARLAPANMPPLPPGMPDGVHHVITFGSLGPARTEMTVTEYGYTTQEAHDISKSGLEECLDKMSESFAGNCSRLIASTAGVLAVGWHPKLRGSRPRTSRP